MRLRSVRRNKLGVSLAVALILAGVVVDLRFSAHPALSIGILLTVAALLTLVGLMHRVWPRRSDK
jgi:hypothetical protein